jgi:hypothetical protein
LSITNPKRENKGWKIVFLDPEDSKHAKYREHPQWGGQAPGPKEHTGCQPAETLQEKSKQHWPGAGLNHMVTNRLETGTGNRIPTPWNGAVATVISGRREWSFFFGTFFFDPHRQRKKYSADWQVSNIPTCRGFLLLLFLTQSKKSSPAKPFCKYLFSLYWFATIKGWFFTFYFAISPRSARPALSKNTIALIALRRIYEPRVHIYKWRYKNEGKKWGCQKWLIPYLAGSKIISLECCCSPARGLSSQ